MSTVVAPTGHVIGATYFSTYWKKRYTVLREEITVIGALGIRVKWDDGRCTTHCTDVGDDPIVE